MEKTAIIHIIRLLVCGMALLPLNSSADTDKISLAGQWGVALDSLGTGIEQNWQTLEFSNKITLPGTLCDAGYGTLCDTATNMTKEVFRNLKRKFDYIGPAWYCRNVNIPKKWKGKRVFLRLERVLWTSEVWINGRKAETVNESLTTPHLFELTGLVKPGCVNTLHIRIDNSKKHDITTREMAHAYTNETQTMWNGVLGDISLIAKPDIFIDEMIIVPDIDNQRVSVSITLSHTKSMSKKGSLTLTVKSPDGTTLPQKSINISGSKVECEYKLSNVSSWDEFNPRLYSMTAELKTSRGTDTKTSTFGMRKLATDKALLYINGRRMFLRGTLESCVFPLTGYPPTDEAGWMKVFKTAQQYGLNHLRFHSWCPSEAAFALADKLGLYLQIELPVWILNIGKDKPTVEFLKQEALNIIKEYGNHPSFCFMSMGNELEGDFNVLTNMVKELRSKDKRHLYTTTTYTFQKGHGDWPENVDDYFITQKTRKGWVRGQGVFEDYPATFNMDYTASIKDITVPIVSHEIGQYSIYPDLTTIGKYTGNLMPLNFMAVADDLKRKGRLDKAQNYTSASGKFSVLLYKEEIERALRTPGFSGFQLLGLSDYPGQSTALVGIVDVFWDSKGLITPTAFRSFCSEVVPLALFDKAVYTNNETFRAQFRTANFKDSVLRNITPEWSLSRTDGTEVASGQLPVSDIAVGNTNNLGQISVPLNSVNVATELTLRLKLARTEYSNSWKIWVYPQTLPAVGNTVLYTQDINEAAEALSKGHKVLFNPEKNSIKGPAGRFVPVFWSPVHFPDQPGTMGILCKPEHPALSAFPTEEHSNWQWRDICVNATTMELDSLGTAIEPVVTMIDNFFKNRSLALVFEANVGKGKIIVCSADLSTDIDNRPEARQLRYSLLRYMESDGFMPEKSLSIKQIKTVLKNNKQESAS